MKRRGGAEHTGLGGGATTLMDGEPTGNKKRDQLIRECSKDVYLTFFKGTSMDGGYCDAGIYGIDGEEIRIGIEPSYQYEELKMIVIQKNREYSEFVTGIAFGPWGSGLRTKNRMYRDFKYQSKFKKFVDKWHPLLFYEN